MTIPATTFPLIASSPARRDIDEFPLGDTVRDLCSRPPPPGWRPTGIRRSYGLDPSERIVRQGERGQNESSGIIDPADGIEHAQTFAPFVAPTPILSAFGRCRDLFEVVRLGMAGAVPGNRS